MIAMMCCMMPSRPLRNAGAAHASGGKTDAAGGMSSPVAGESGQVAEGRTHGRCSLQRIHTLVSCNCAARTRAARAAVQAGGGPAPLTQQLAYSAGELHAMCSCCAVSGGLLNRAPSGESDMDPEPQDDDLVVNPTPPGDGSGAGPSRGA